MDKLLSFVSKVFIVCFCLTACDLIGDWPGSGQGLFGYSDPWASLVNEKSEKAIVNRETVTYGSHSYTLSGNVDFNFNPAEFRGGVTAAVEFTNIPSGYNEFKTVYEALLGKSLQGTAAMVPMAMEIYARNPNTGEKCFTLLCKDEATVSGILRILKTKIPRSAEEEKDKYMQRYLPAALLKGALYDNAYTPSKPYVVEVGPDSTLPQEAKMSPYGTLYYTRIYADGWESRNRSVKIFLPKGENLFKVQECSSCYTQCKDIFGGPWPGLE